MNKQRSNSQLVGNVTANPAENDSTKHKYAPDPEVSTPLNSSSETKGHKKTRSMSGSSNVVGEEGMNAAGLRAAGFRTRPDSPPLLQTEPGSKIQA
ncbi:hypothetical protein L6J37_20320 [Photobacterium sp. WH77]|uniref:hypothetical protein n=1 Tax=unclassified Photobacterium TaxID=2628852 RepID=UPI001EDA0881|nr:MULTISPECIES: hypothetical protein [unclassified Photobacterium]MCG2839179.1 hypothetical protein [Photobacterium sp. WH77]MCG2846796.1 hypothetical protein [Photobacterium sp. WH80]